MEPTNETIFAGRKLLKTYIEKDKNILSQITMMIILKEKFMTLFMNQNQIRKVMYLNQILNLVPRTIFLHLIVTNQIQMIK